MNIAIASGKGGTGKTTLSVNLASYLSELEHQKVVLVDLDVEEPNSSLFLNGTTHKQDIKYRAVPQWDAQKCTHCGQCKSHCNFNAIAALAETILVFPDLCHSCFACSELCPEQALPMVDQRMGVLNHQRINDNLNFVEGVLDVGQESGVLLIKSLKSYVKRTTAEDAFIIYDSPPGVSCPVIEAVKEVDYVILVTEPTPFGLHDLKLAVDTMKALNRPFGVVINRYGIGSDLVDVYCREQQISILARIPNMKKIAVLYAEGKLLYQDIPEVKSELLKIYSTIKSSMTHK